MRTRLQRVLVCFTTGTGETKATLVWYAGLKTVEKGTVQNKFPEKATKKAERLAIDSRFFKLSFLR